MQKTKLLTKATFQQMEDFRGLEAGVKAAEAFIHFKTKVAARAIS